MTRSWARSIIAALGGTTICCFWILSPLVSSSHYAIYHWSGAASTLFIPSTLDFLCVWFAFAILFLGTQGTTRGSAAIWIGLIFFLPWAALKNVNLLMGWAAPNWISRSLFGSCIASTVFFTTRFDPLHKNGLVRLRDALMRCLSIVAVPGAVILFQCLWFGWQAHSVKVTVPLHQQIRVLSKSRSARPRIIWIVFDELSYQQLYEQRFVSLTLPAFDRLAKESTVFTRVIPAGMMTATVMPSLITGAPADQIRSVATGDGVTIRNPLTQRWHSLDQHDTVFSDALTAGYSTAIAGWYNPYCRILPEVLDQCFWTLSLPSDNAMLPNASIARNALNPLLLHFNLLGIRPKELLAELHISDYRQLSDAADKLLRSPSLDFILIHLPIPHPEGIYDRKTHSFAIRNSSYIDNLALADSYLAHVRCLLESTGSWDSSAVVVMGDHSWRTKLLWAASPDWTSEEQQASRGGHFDDRPAYIVKLPGQKQGKRITLPFDAVDTRLLFNAIMKKQIASASDLLSWTAIVNCKGARR